MEVMSSIRCPAIRPDKSSSGHVGPAIRPPARHDAMSSAYSPYQRSSSRNTIRLPSRCWLASLTMPKTESVSLLKMGVEGLLLAAAGWPSRGSPSPSAVDGCGEDAPALALCCATSLFSRMVTLGLRLLAQLQVRVAENSTMVGERGFSTKTTALLTTIAISDNLSVKPAQRQLLSVEMRQSSQSLHGYDLRGRAAAVSKTESEQI